MRQTFCGIAVALLACATTGCLELTEAINGEGSIDTEFGEMTFSVDAELPPHEDGEICDFGQVGTLTLSDCEAGWQAEIVTQTVEDLESCIGLHDWSDESFAGCIEFASECPTIAIVAGRYEARSCSGNRGNGKGGGRNNKKGKGNAYGHDKNPGRGGNGGEVISTGCMVAYFFDDTDGSTLDGVAVIMVDDSGEEFYVNCGNLATGSLESIPYEGNCQIEIELGTNDDDDVLVDGEPIEDGELIEGDYTFEVVPQ